MRAASSVALACLLGAVSLGGSACRRKPSPKPTPPSGWTKVADVGEVALNALVADAQHVYWSDRKRGIVRAAHDGSDSTVLATDKGFELRLDASRVFFLSGFTLRRVPAHPKRPSYGNEVRRFAVHPTDDASSQRIRCTGKDEAPGEVVDQPRPALRDLAFQGATLVVADAFGILRYRDRKQAPASRSTPSASGP